MAYTKKQKANAVKAAKSKKTLPGLKPPIKLGSTKKFPKKPKNKKRG